jgi:hypothetical protein
MNKNTKLYQYFNVQNPLRRGIVTNKKAMLAFHEEAFIAHVRRHYYLL